MFLGWHESVFPASAAFSFSRWPYIRIGNTGLGSDAFSKECRLCFGASTLPEYLSRSYEICRNTVPNLMFDFFGRGKGVRVFKVESNDPPVLVGKIFIGARLVFFQVSSLCLTTVIPISSFWFGSNSLDGGERRSYTWKTCTKQHLHFCRRHQMHWWFFIRFSKDNNVDRQSSGCCPVPSSWFVPLVIFVVQS